MITNFIAKKVENFPFNNKNYWINGITLDNNLFS